MLKLNLQSVLISSLQKHQNVCESMNKSNIKEKATGIPEASLSINLSFAHNIYIFFFVIVICIWLVCITHKTSYLSHNLVQMSVQTSIIRRRLGIRAAFQVLASHGEQQAE